LEHVVKNPSAALPYIAISVDTFSRISVTKHGYFQIYVKGTFAGGTCEGIEMTSTDAFYHKYFQRTVISATEVLAVAYFNCQGYDGQFVSLSATGSGAFSYFEIAISPTISYNGVI